MAGISTWASKLIPLGRVKRVRLREAKWSWSSREDTMNVNQEGIPASL